jgi:alkyl sulfatase BDS1-like metallo-beta-lactamase superfamily hydrolase
MPDSPGTPHSEEGHVATAIANREAAALYDLAERQDFADADRGLIAPFPGRLLAPDGHVTLTPGGLAGEA